MYKGVFQGVYFFSMICFSSFYASFFVIFSLKAPICTFGCVEECSNPDRRGSCTDLLIVLTSFFPSKQSIIQNKWT